MSGLPTSPFVLLEDSKSYNRVDAGLLFDTPAEIITCNNIHEVPDKLDEILKWQTRGFYVAGWFSYESAFAFHPTLKRKATKQSYEPFVWMGVFEKPQRMSSQELNRLFTNIKKANPAAGLKDTPKLGEEFEEFEKALIKIQQYISDGDVYQVNHTFRMELEALGEVPCFYADLRKAQPAPFGALINTGDRHILSLSPELFITRTGDVLKSSPMKGTASVGLDMYETRAAMKALSRDKKNQAENLMITDLIRNDFSRVCKPGSVGVENMFAVTKFSKVLQMTSDVKGTLKPGVSFPDIFKALFPCGSVTGAPKIRAMEIIEETEKAPRGVYTGAIGYLAPDNDFVFSVPIRTALLEQTGKGWMGIGSGVIADSKIKDEYDECRLKGAFLSADTKDFALIETMLWVPEKGFQFLQEHLARLRTSAEYFEFSLEEKEIEKALQSLANSFETASKKVRLLCQADGKFTVECFATTPPSKKIKKIILSSNPVKSTDPFLFHKTTIRPLYELEKKTAGPSVYDVIFRNEKEEITEGTFNNIFIETTDKMLLTPEKKCGLLPGVFREKLLLKNFCKEASLTCDDLKNAKKIFLANSVSGLVKVKLEG